MKEYFPEPKPRLTKIEAHQLEKRTLSSEGEAQNPYAVLRSALVSEPEGAYEKDFKELSATQKHEKLRGQIETSAEMTIRLEKYVEDNLGKVDQMTDTELYKVLCGVAFETEDENEIEKKYALSQRRGFKLSIVNFLEGKSKLDPFRLEAEADPKAFAEKYLQEKLVGDISVEHLPFGFVIYLDEEDYALFGSKEKSIKSITSHGKTLSWNSFPEELRSKVIIINKNGKESGTSEEQVVSTRRHEIAHILFTEFYEQQGPAYDIVAALSVCKTEKDYQNVSKALVQNFTEKAKDEIIAYSSHGEFNNSYFDLKFGVYRLYVDKVKTALKHKKTDIPEEVKIKILETFTKDRRICFEIIRRIKLVAESMHRLGDENQNNISEALLRNTPGDKVHRLAKYTEFSEEDIKSNKILKEKDKEVNDELDTLPTMPERYSDDWWDQTSPAMEHVEDRINIEVLPVLLNKIKEWGDRRWGRYFTIRAVSFVKDFVELLGVTSVEKEEVEQVMKSIISIELKTQENRQNARELKKVKELKKLAKEVLALIKSP